uniref:Small ribosomal subunit protein mS23 conserved domain-containing protein n=2 Tax=Passeriformes TaxID=9126 RepID=A0A803VVI0_FICAL
LLKQPLLLGLPFYGINKAAESKLFPFLSRRFYQVYGNGPRPFDLTQLNFKSTCQRFVEKYNELKEEGKIEEEKLFEETGKALLASGILLQRRGVDKVSIKYSQMSLLQ